MEFLSNLSYPARIPAFDARLNHQDGQDLSLGIPFDEANHISNSQHAAGGVRSSTLPSTRPPSIFTSDGQLRALLSTSCFSTEVNTGRGLGFPNSDYPFTTSPQGSEWSSSSSSSPSSSITSPVSEEWPLPFTSPDLAFQDLSMNDPDPLQAYQYSPDLSLLTNEQLYKTPPKQSFFRPVALPEVCTPNMSVIPDQNVGINNAGAIPRRNSFPTVPPFSETALGLYYPSPPQSLEIPPLSTQADASILSALPSSTNSRAKTRKVWAVVPTARTIRVRSGRMHAVATAAAAIAASTAFGTGKNSIPECDICGFRPTTLRKADLRRHEKKHQDAKETRYVCCGIPATHPATAGLVPVCCVRWYKKRKFLGGCGKSYSRMDALQRHSGKSGCASGTAKDHQIWRQLYF